MVTSRGVAAAAAIAVAVAGTAFNRAVSLNDVKLLKGLETSVDVVDRQAVAAAPISRHLTCFEGMTDMVDRD